MADIRKVGLITVQDNRILLCRKRGGQRLILPGGKPEAGETSLETLVRELEEELGDVRLHKPLWLATYLDQTAGDHWDAPQTIEIEVYTGQLHGQPRPSQEIEELVWFGEDSDWGPLAPSLKRQILPDLLDRGLVVWPKTGRV